MAAAQRAGLAGNALTHVAVAAGRPARARGHAAALREVLRGAPSTAGLHEPLLRPEGGVGGAEPMATSAMQSRTRRRTGVVALTLAVLAAAAGVVALLALRHDERPGPAQHALHATPRTLGRVFTKARGGETILLAPGSYGSFAAGEKSSVVTIRPEPGASARISLALPAAANVRFEGLTIAGADIGGSTHDVTIVRSTFTQQIVIHADRMRDARVVLDGNRLAGIDACPDC